MSITVHPIAGAIADYRGDTEQARLAEMLAAFTSFHHANEELARLTGILNFFADDREYLEFRGALLAPLESVAAKNREWGDFQTPPHLAREVCEYLRATGYAPTALIEPTFGKGNFILAALDAFPSLQFVYGVEIQPKYKWHLKLALLSRAWLVRRVQPEILLHLEDFFVHSFPPRGVADENILILGNPPWVTNAELGALGSANLPAKRNFKTLDGMDALTGKSNFDISESILLRLLDRFASSRGALAMLCKMATAKNIVELLPKKQYRVSDIRMLEIDAARDFEASVGACLLVMQLGAPKSNYTCRVATLENPRRIEREFGWVRNKFVSNVRAYELNANLDGVSRFEWRQGLKHDCARVMELEVGAAGLVNGNGESVAVEPEYLYGFLKGSDLRSFGAEPTKQVIVTQMRLGEDTGILKTHAPKLWNYLLKHSRDLDERKSSIYRGKPRFSIFGIGDYSFQPYKVGIAGFYKEPNFALIAPDCNRPVMLDDTTYFLGFDNYLDALFTASLLNSARVRQFLQSIVFADAKRPYTKEILMRVDLAQAARDFSFTALTDFWSSIGYAPRVSVSEMEWEHYRDALIPKEEPMLFDLPPTA